MRRPNYGYVYFRCADPCGLRVPRDDGTTDFSLANPLSVTYISTEFCAGWKRGDHV